MLWAIPANINNCSQLNFSNTLPKMKICEMATTVWPANMMGKWAWLVAKTLIHDPRQVPRDPRNTECRRPCKSKQILSNHTYIYKKTHLRNRDGFAIYVGICIMYLLWCQTAYVIFSRSVNFKSVHLHPKQTKISALASKLYTPSTLNIDLIQWHTQLIVCVENVKSWFKSWVFPFNFQAYILPHTLNCMCVGLFKFHIWILE